MLGICAGIRSHNPLLTIPWFSEMDDERSLCGKVHTCRRFCDPAAYVETSCCDTSLATAAPYTSIVEEQMQPSSTRPNGWLWTRNTLCSSRWESSFLLARDRVSRGSLQQGFARLDTRASSYQRTILTDAYLWFGKLRGDNMLKVCGTLGFATKKTYCARAQF
jgi:hypothetical protein